MRGALTKVRRRRQGPSGLLLLLVQPSPAIPRNMSNKRAARVMRLTSTSFTGGFVTCKIQVPSPPVLRFRNSFSSRSKSCPQSARRPTQHDVHPVPERGELWVKSPIGDSQSLLVFFRASDERRLDATNHALKHHRGTCAERTTTADLRMDSRNQRKLRRGCRRRY